MTDIGTWLRSLGLGEYESAFRENAVDASVLPDLTADDLKEMGIVAVGHRRKLLAAIATLRSQPSSAASLPPPGDAGTGHGADSDGAERRQLTVLFCDLAGSTALSARLDPEDLREVMVAYHRVVSEAVRKHGGYVAKLLGDGVLAYFGWPQAHEDDAERAVRAGFAAVAAVANLEAPGGGRLAARVGLATGPVVVGEVLGEGEARERGVVGETPNLAARLQGRAEPGAVVADEVTCRLTGRLFAWADLGNAVLRGLPKLVRPWQALGESGVESRFEALRTGHSAPLIGRKEELDLLLRRWRQARAGEGQVVLLRGEAGIGKSRLTAALHKAIAGDGHEELVLQCSPQHTDSSLYPVVVRLERTAELAVGDPPEARLTKLEALLVPIEPSSEDVALLADLLSVPTLGRWPALDLSPQARRARLLQALLRRVRALAARQPVLAVVEDAHWIDPTTRELLDLLVAEASGVALLLVVTQRPEFDARGWAGQAHVTELTLNRLGRSDHRGLLRYVAGGKALPEKVEAEVLARTDGVPLFVEEVGRAVLESGLLREEADRWTLDAPLPRLAVPDSLQASLVARLDRLSSMREVAQVGAVLGREFSHELLAAVAGMPEPALRAALDALAVSDLVQRRGTPPDAAYAFRHALIRDAAHGTLLRERRRELHARAAEAIARLRPDAAEREPEVLAHHRAEAGEAEAAAALYRRAGERAAARAAFREARAHLARGLDLLPGVPDQEATRRLEAGLRIALGDVAIVDQGLGSAEAGRAYGRAVALCRGLGDDALLAAGLWGLWAHTAHTGDLAAALPLAEETVELARRRGAAPDQRWRSLAVLGMAHCLAGRSELARPLLEETAAGVGSYAPGSGAVSGGSLAQSFLARMLAGLGALERSAAHAAEAVERAREAGHLLSLANTLVVCSAQAWLVRDAGLLARRARALDALAEAQGFAYWTIRARPYLGWAAVEQGRVAEGITLLEDGLAAIQGAGIVLHTSHVEAMLCDASLLAEDAGAALGHIEEALALSIRSGEAWFDAELHRRRGNALLRLASDDPTHAEREFLRALEVARSQSARLFELRAARDLARLRRDQGRIAEARDLLASVYTTFTEGFTFPDLIEARALLEELEAG